MSKPPAIDFVTAYDGRGRGAATCLAPKHAKTLTNDVGGSVTTLERFDHDGCFRPPERAACVTADMDVYAVLTPCFEARVAETPDAVAVVCEDERLTYQGLNEAANRLAHYLIARGVGPETLVALAFERSISMIVAILAVLKAGGGYVPLDPSRALSAAGLLSSMTASCPLLLHPREMSRADGLARVLPPWGAWQFISSTARRWGRRSRASGPRARPIATGSRRCGRATPPM